MAPRVHKRGSKAERKRQDRRNALALAHRAVRRGEKVKLPRLLRHYTLEQKRDAVNAYFDAVEQAGKAHGQLRAVAAQVGVHEASLQGWVERATRQQALGRLGDAAPAVGRPSFLGSGPEAAIAAVVWRCWKANATLEDWQVLAIATDTAKKKDLKDKKVGTLFQLLPPFSNHLTLTLPAGRRMGSHN